MPLPRAVLSRDINYQVFNSQDEPEEMLLGPFLFISSMHKLPAIAPQSDPALIQHLYFRLRNAWVDANKTEAQSWYRAMKRAVNTIKIPLEEVLAPHELDQLEEIVEAAQTGVFKRTLRPLTDEDEQLWNGSLQVDESKIIPEKELQDLLAHSYWKDLAKMVGRPNMRLVDVEYETFHGRVDLLGEDEATRTMVIIELKRGAANHAVVSQLLKYAEHFEKRMMWKLWNHVECISIAGGYSRYAYAELRRLGIQTLTYEYSLGQLILRKDKVQKLLGALIEKIDE